MSETPIPARRSRSPLIAILLLVIAALILALGVLIVDRQRLNARLDEAQSALAASAAGTTGAAGSTGGAEGSRTPAASDELAIPSATDPAQLEIIRAQARRDPDDPQAFGKADAPVVMVLYSDFACPYCTLFAKEVEPGLADLINNGTLRIEWRDLAQITETSPLAARAGRAAAAQGRFWEFHDAVYAAAGEGEHPEYTQENLLEFARAAAVPDLDAFTATMNAEETKTAVEEAKTKAYSIGVQGTPFMFIGDAFVSGYRELDVIRATVLAQAEAAK
ncbi:MAG: thioredoxin domain-containing protein [Schaalia hyovaginalis]|uniref:DsbA family protein n=1 Tax=Schaalia hyovaginalis TaxID=29316 RepID=UPI001F2EB88F|nr:thioredoxin domain-containing protein [Schaalia hyovaginalis]MCI6411174.1 DsbA family protein [Schaalia hyovaginalis]MCI6557451.1 DsbA family protein [Schaalia hyovaginalis]MCI7512955.1 DsbA family protein [Schaalia hyovaginalis]MDY3666127.1 thioredoxin domain-containing protein [Schaalia hyovaginalis]MDY6214101.1 thioredoxin domain-containing protein [Schaalia hyovaginalis]